MGYISCRFYLSITLGHQSLEQSHFFLIALLSPPSPWNSFEIVIIMRWLKQISILLFQRSKIMRVNRKRKLIYDIANGVETKQTSSFFMLCITSLQATYRLTDQPSEYSTSELNNRVLCYHFEEVEYACGFSHRGRQENTFGIVFGNLTRKRTKLEPIHPARPLWVWNKEMCIRSRTAEFWRTSILCLYNVLAKSTITNTKSQSTVRNICCAHAGRGSCRGEAPRSIRGICGPKHRWFIRKVMGKRNQRNGAEDSLISLVPRPTFA